MSAAAELLARVPDEPVWVEARSLLLQVPATRLWHAGGSDGFVALQADRALGVVVGAPPKEWIAEAATRVRAEGSILGYPDNVDVVTRVLPKWERESATIFRLPADACRAESLADVRWMHRNDLACFDASERSLREELAGALERGPMAVAHDGGEPAAFCYGRETESWWDVSIDTRGKFRRRGHARRCVAWMIARMRERGKEPVWGAVASNLASQRLAAQLGFQPVGELSVFRRSDAQLGRL